MLSSASNHLHHYDNQNLPDAGTVRSLLFISPFHHPASGWSILLRLDLPLPDMESHRMEPPTYLVRLCGHLYPLGDHLIAHL